MGHYWSVEKVALRFGWTKQSKNLKRYLINRCFSKKNMYTYLVLMLPSLAGFSVFRLAIFYGEIYCFLTQLQEDIEVSKLVRTILKRLFATALYFYMKQANTLSIWQVNTKLRSQFGKQIDIFRSTASSSDIELYITDDCKDMQFRDGGGSPSILIWMVQ